MGNIKSRSTLLSTLDEDCNVTGAAWGTPNPTTVCSFLLGEEEASDDATGTFDENV